MSQTYATMTLGGVDRNVEFLGDYVAWLISNSLLSTQLEGSASTEVTRVRMQDMTGPEFLTTVLYGELTSGHLSDTGQAFTESYLMSGQYDQDYIQVPAEENDWIRYRELSTSITKAYQQYNESLKPRKSARILKFPG